MEFSSYVFLLSAIFAIYFGFRANRVQQPSLTPILQFGSSLNRSSFPSDFIFGTASSAYSVEGAANEDGKGPSIWDTYTHKNSDKIDDGSNADVAIDLYHRYKEDVGMMKQMNLDAYKFSISWSRILPKGKLSGGINKEGIKYYNNLIDELLANGLKPFVTLYHWDLPQALEDEYGGLLSPNIVKDFEDYAELCFKEFGDRVKTWLTVHEPWAFSMAGYVVGSLAPGRCSNWLNPNCNGGDSGTEPYLVAHHLLLSHAAAVKVYRTKYQESQNGMIGMSLVSHWFIPYTNEESDEEAANRALDFMLGWFLDPLTKGGYPESMRSLVGERLPKFTEEEAKLIRGSFDFIGIDYYTSLYAAHAPHLSDASPAPCYLFDSLVNLTTQRNGRPIGTRAASEWLYIYPRGLGQLLLHIKANYNNPLIYITENGVDEFNDPTLSMEEVLMDINRIDFFYRHLYYIQAAVRDGVNVKGYFAWCLADGFEWHNGFTLHYGMHYVDHKNGLKRHPKLSAQWFRNFLQR